MIVNVLFLDDHVPPNCNLPAIESNKIFQKLKKDIQTTLNETSG